MWTGCWGDLWLGQIFPGRSPHFWELWVGCKEEYLECFSTVLMGSDPFKQVVLRPDMYFVPLTLYPLLLSLPPYLACALFYFSPCPHLYSSVLPFSST